jgi:hypothetical protein
MCVSELVAASVAVTIGEAKGQSADACSGSVA